jgi:hypothetical protein
LAVKLAPREGQIEAGAFSIKICRHCLDWAESDRDVQYIDLSGISPPRQNTRDQLPAADQLTLCSAG